MISRSDCGRASMSTRLQAKRAQVPVTWDRTSMNNPSLRSNTTHCHSRRINNTDSISSHRLVLKGSGLGSHHIANMEEPRDPVLRELSDTGAEHHDIIRSRHCRHKFVEVIALMSLHGFHLPPESDEEVTNDGGYRHIVTS
jgi:hypothetical protein